jgi:peptidoglycan/xylan/chitin deacetylase (PgdA/CDA1 family)
MVGFRVPILMYHSIAEAGPEGLAPWRLLPALFREQMRLLRERGYHSVSLEEWARAIVERRPLPGRPVVLTFDDGYRDFLEHAWPVLRECDLRATIFVVTGRVGGVADWVAGEPPLALMDWAELRELQRQGNRVGSHCAAHRELTQLPDEELRRDAAEARAALRRELGTVTQSVAFPYGISDGRVRRLLAESGYRIGLSAAGGLSTLADDPMQLPRIEIFGDDDADAFALKIDADNHEGDRARIAVRSDAGVAGCGEPRATSPGPREVTVVVTSCGRQDLLERSLDSFFAFNTYPVSRIIVVEDGARAANTSLMRKYADRDIRWLDTGRRVGQILAIDYAYAFVETPYIFHLEDDWEFSESGFIEKSLAVLEGLPDCLQVWIRALDDTNRHPLCPETVIVSGIPVRRLQLGFLGRWSGFSFNPGLRRRADYDRLRPYRARVGGSHLEPGEPEFSLSETYRQLGFYAVILADNDGRGYVRHIGEGRRIPQAGVPPSASPAAEASAL